MISLFPTQKGTHSAKSSTEALRQQNFSGLNQEGTEVTKEVKTSSILAMREVASKPIHVTESSPNSDPKQESEELPVEQPHPKTDDMADGESKSPVETTSEEKELNSELPATSTVGHDAPKVKSIASALREKMSEVEKNYATLSQPGRTITSIMKGRKEHIDTQLGVLDRISVAVSNLQEQYNRTTTSDYVFSEVQADQRDAYVQNGIAAYKAMKNDMIQKSVLARSQDWTNLKYLGIAIKASPSTRKHTGGI